MNSLRKKALIVDLTISQWMGRKMDRKVTKEVEDAHDAKRAGTFSKNLVDPTYLQPIVRAVNEIRKHHNDNTLPWGESGERVLPSKNYFTYMQGLKELRDRFDDEVKTFMLKYDFIKEDAKRRLKTMFDEKEYPTSRQLESKFGVQIRYEPIPEHSDFRIEGLAGDDVEQIKAAIEQDVKCRHAEAVKDLVERTKEVIGRIIKVLGTEERTRITDSLMDSVSALIEIIPMLNYTNDEGVDRMCNDLKSINVTSDELRKDEVVRKHVYDRAKELEKMYF